MAPKMFLAALKGAGMCGETYHFLRVPPHPETGR